MGFVGEMFFQFFSDVFSDIYSKIGFIITDIYTYAVEINELKEVEAVSTFAMLLGASLCALVVIKQIIGTYGIGTEGDPDQDPIEIIFRLCKALGIMGANSFLFTEILKFSNAVGRDIISSMNIENNNGIVQEKILDMVGNNGSPAWMLCSGAIIVGMILFGISACVRGAELTLNKILLPIFCLDILNTNPEKWKMFIFQYIMGFFSFILQMLCFNIYIIQFLKVDITQIEIRQIMVLGAWLIMSIKTPQWLEKYIYATGTGRAISQGASRLGQVVMYMGMRI